MTTVRIQGMKCQHCAATAKKTLEDLGATGVVIDLDKGEARFEGALDGAAVRQAIAAKGFAVAE
ncbi:MAG: heavy-metal-associated domain-containing protein [Desulfobulbus sp.]|uniref:heavy-metal-associated domain-containing protein n=1 Tax=Desulfobulbus sp. TaxID=895 RepID=UPI00283C3230|nr:heavy metal-associated domain-containing protein [Desulfobulbus sp.]MDR2549649.1 heavy-metal-associated domain-containing protein [Desulfobulbus sp.]